MKAMICKTGCWCALAAFGATTAYCIVQVLQVAKLLAYPLDEILIYGFSLCIVVPLLLAMLALHYVTPHAKKYWSHAALFFTLLYAVFVLANYVVQLATVIPMKLSGRGAAVVLLEQTPHSMFWNFDALGYIFLGLATLAAVPVFGSAGIQRWVKRFFLANALVTPLIAVVYFYPAYSHRLLLLGFAWGITAPGAMLLLALHFRNMLRVKKEAGAAVKDDAFIPAG